MNRAAEGRDRTRVRLVLYTRDPCHLCDVAKTALRRLAACLPLEIVERDVDRRPDWRDRYGDEVPVGLIDGRKVFKYRVDVDALERAVRWRSTGLR